MNKLLSKATALHILAHGGHTPHFWFGSTMLTAQDIVPLRQNQVSMNIILINSCELASTYPSNNSGGANAMAQAFLNPYGDDSNPVVDKAAVYWITPMNYSAQNGDSEVASAFWGALASGKTAHEARDAMIEAYSVYQGAINPGFPEEWACCFGDPVATLHRLYTGSDIPSSTWHD